MASTEVERHSGVDTADVPSANWGWSGDYPRVWHIGGILVGVFLLAMLHGNHSGHTEDWFLIVFAAAVFFVVFRDMWRRRKGTVR